METCELIRALRTVPEFRLRLIGLAWEVVGDDGSPNRERLAFRGKELEEAIAEAEAYSQAAREAVQCLTRWAALNPSPKDAVTWAAFPECSHRPPWGDGGI